MGKYIERKKSAPSMKERIMMSAILSADILGLIESEIVKIDTEYNPEILPRPITFLWLTSTRELLTDEIRDRLIENWREALSIFAQYLGYFTPAISGLTVCQADYGFDPHSLEFRDNRHIEGHYR